MSRLLSTLLSQFFSASALPASLTVAAASDLTAVEPELAAAFRKIEPSTDLHYVTAASAVQAMGAGMPAK